MSQYTARWDLTPRSSHTLYPDSVAFPWDCARFSLSPDSDTGDSEGG